MAHLDKDMCRRRREMNLALVIAFLVIICFGLGALAALALRGAEAFDNNPDQQRMLARLAWLSVAMLLGTMVLLVWAVMRFARGRVFREDQEARRPKEEHIDAWAEAGRRFQLAPDDEPEEPDAQDD